MHVGEVMTADVANGEGMRVSVFVSGCRNHCKGCFQPQTWDFNYGREYTPEIEQFIIDELSSFKSPKAQRFKDLKKVRPMAKRVVGLTGTPGNLMDLWAEIGILDMGQRLGRYIGGYRDRFFLPDKRNREIIFSYKPREGA